MWMSIILQMCALNMVAAQLPLPYNDTGCDVAVLAEQVTRVNEACCIQCDQQTCDNHPCDVGCVRSIILIARPLLTLYFKI